MAALNTVIVVLLLAVSVALRAQDAMKPADADPVLNLRDGGHALHFRHARTDGSQADPVRKAGDWLSGDPAHIRQLSDEGRSTARQVGKALRTLRIAAARVPASPCCCTVERVAEAIPEEVGPDGGAATGVVGLDGGAAGSPATDRRHPGWP